MEGGHDVFDDGDEICINYSRRGGGYICMNYGQGRWAVGGGLVGGVWWAVGGAGAATQLVGDAPDGARIASHSGRISRHGRRRPCDRHDRHDHDHYEDGPSDHVIIIIIIIIIIITIDDDDDDDVDDGVCLRVSEGSSDRLILGGRKRKNKKIIFI